MKEIVLKPNLVAVQNVFFGRLYSADLFLMYRALSGRYYLSPSLPIMSAGLGASQDLYQTLGALGPTARSLWFGNVLEVFYNNEIRDTVMTLPELRDAELLEGWNRFSELLMEEVEKVGPPFPTLPPLAYRLEAFELPREQVEALPPADKFIYYTYRADADWTEYGYALASEYVPETFAAIQPISPDFKMIFTMYGDCVKERLTGVPTSREARIIAKSVLLSNYRWYMLLSDLLAPVDPAFTTRGFRRGIERIASMLRDETEKIRL